MQACLVSGIAILKIVYFCKNSLQQKKNNVP